MKRPNSKFIWTLILSTCLVLAMCFGTVFLLAGCNNTEAEAGTVTMEINPGVEFTIARNGSVKAVRFLNDDAEDVLGALTLKGQDLRTAVALAISAYKASGYMDRNDTVLVSFNIAKTKNCKNRCPRTCSPSLKKPTS